MRGSREEIIEGLAQVSEQYGLPLDHAAIERIADRAIRRIKFGRALRAIVVFGIPAIIIGIIVVVVVFGRQP
jgi:t-SNARE complex subunit (syntaxin)